ncbi:MAG TPA: STAS domain-containing protein [Mycobacteriales bacterium]|nr:STAS domain-containing protein [Mycobacteriales bacterium]
MPARRVDPDVVGTERDTPDAVARATELVGLARSVHERLSFLEAQGVLAGLCNCSDQRAGAALLRAAARQGIASPDAGTLFLSALETAQTANADPESFAAAVFEALLLPVWPARLQAVLTEDGNGLRITGEVDAAAERPLLGAVMALCEGDDVRAHTKRALVLDLSSVTFLDSSGVQVLSTVDRYIRGQGRTVSVVPPRRRVPSWVLGLAVSAGWLGSPFAPPEDC